MPGSFMVVIGCLILMMFASLGCEAVPSAVPSSTSYHPATPTFTGIPYLTPALSPDPTSTTMATPTMNMTRTNCRGFRWAYGTVPPGFISQVQDAMKSAGLEGSVRASTFGETDLCGTNYGAKDVDYFFTVQVGEFDTREDITRKVAVVQEIARRFVEKSTAPLLGRVSLTFKSGELQCTWRFEDEPWEFFSVTGANGAGCRLPTNDRTRPLAAALTALSADLACESFTMTADMLSIALECKRLQEANRYTVHVTFAYERQETPGGTCFHGWPAHEKNLSGPAPVTVIEDGRTFYEQERSFAWTTGNDLTTFIYERIRGGQGVTFPPDTSEKIYLRSLQEHLIPGAGPGTECG